MASSQQENELTGHSESGGIQREFEDDFRECSFSYSENGGRGSLPNEYGGRDSLLDKWGLRGSFHGERRGRDSFYSETSGRGSFYGQSRGQGSFYAEGRGRGSSYGQSRGRGSPYGQSRGRGSSYGQSSGRGSSYGQSSGRGSSNGQSRGRGSSYGQSRGHGKVLQKLVRVKKIKSSKGDRLGSFCKQYKGTGSVYVQTEEGNSFNAHYAPESRTGEGIPSDESGFSLKCKVREDKNYEKMKHLFEDLTKDSFPDRLKNFNGLTLPEAIYCASNVTTSIFQAGKKIDTAFKEALEHLRRPTLREVINLAKYTILHFSKGGNFQQIRDPRFPRTIPTLGAVVEREIKKLTGVDAEYKGDDLLKILSSTGRCIISFRLLDCIFKVHQSAADFLIANPEFSNIFKLGGFSLNFNETQQNPLVGVLTGNETSTCVSDC